MAHNASTSVQRFYRRQARVYDWTRWAFLLGRREAIARLALRPDHSVLEIGCGTGLNFHHVLRHLDPQRGQLIGLDFSEPMLRQARRRVAANRWPHVHLVAADACRMTLARSFDAILFAYSLSLIPDWPAALERACWHLRPGGRLVVLDFGPLAAWGPMAPLLRAWLRFHHVDTQQPYLQKMAEVLVDPEHVHRLGGYYFIAAGTKSLSQYKSLPQ